MQGPAGAWRSGGHCCIKAKRTPLSSLLTLIVHCIQLLIEQHDTRLCTRTSWQHSLGESLSCTTRLLWNETDAEILHSHVRTCPQVRADRLAKEYGLKCNLCKAERPPPLFHCIARSYLLSAFPSFCRDLDRLVTKHHTPTLDNGL
jgi:hypothetical protein